MPQAYSVDQACAVKIRSHKGLPVCFACIWECQLPSRLGKNCKSIQNGVASAGAVQDAASDLEVPCDADVLRACGEQNSHVPLVEAQGLCAGMLTACIAF